jgi:glycosyltransferase involved in cell wall biosynthesis
MGAAQVAPVTTKAAAYRTGIAGSDSSRGPRAILHIVSSLGVGGMERMLLQLATAQQEAGHRVSVLALRAGPLEQEAADRSIRVKILSSGTGRFGRSLEALRVFRAERPDIVHVHNPTSLQYAVLSKLVSRAAIVVTIHGDQDTHARLGSSFEWALTSAAVIVSHAAGKTLRLPSHAAPFVVVHNGIAAAPANEQHRADARAELGAGDACVGILVARIDGRKGHATLLKSLRAVDDLGVTLKMWIVGDGSARAAAESQAARLGLGPDRVRFLGRRSDIDRLLNAADFFVLPSDIEGLPLSILEAMAHGLPIVASNVGGVPEIIQDGINGLLVPAGDDAALAAAIRRVATDPVLRRRLGDAARERANTAFSLSTMMQKYDLLYDEALARGTRRL